MSEYDLHHHVCFEDDIYCSRPVAILLARYPEMYAKIFKADKNRRQGPLQLGVQEEFVPTIWAHTERVWMAAKLFPWEAFGFTQEDREEAELLAFIHDFAVETHGPDYTLHDDISADQKEAEERVSLDKFISSIGPGGEEILAIWERYQSKLTPIAKIVGQLDKIIAADEAWHLEYDKVPVEEGYPAIFSS